MNKGEKYIVKLNQNTAHFGEDYLPSDGVYIFDKIGFTTSGDLKFYFIGGFEFFINAIDDIKTL